MRVPARLDTQLRARLDSKLGAILLLALVACTPDPTVVQPIEFGWVWSKTFGGAGNDYASAVAVNAKGDVYVAGSSDAGFGWSYAGKTDGFVRKFDAQGSSLWTQAIAMPGDDAINDLAVTADQRILAVGSSDGPNGLGSSLADAILQSWDVNGIAGHGLRFGSPKADAAVAVAVAGNDAVIVGWTNGALEGNDANPKARDAFVTRLSLNVAGLWDSVWSRQLACAEDCEASGVSLDPDGNVYVSGFSFGGVVTASASKDSNVFVAKFAPDGTRLWLSPIGANGEDTANAIAADSSGAYVVGYSNGTIADQVTSGLDDAFIARLNPQGQTQWVRFLGSTQADAAVDVALNSNGAQLVGYSEGSLPGQASAGRADAFLAQYDANGTRTSLVTLGGPGNDYANGISLARNARLEPNGTLYIAGYTVNEGLIDASVARYGPVP